MRIVGALTQRTPDRRYVHRQIRFFDDLIRPNECEQFILRQQLPAIADQDEQHLEGFAMQWNQLSLPHELALVRFKLELVEFVDESGLCRHDAVILKTTEAGTLRGS